eukprot:gene16711-biopygen6782
MGPGQVSSVTEGWCPEQQCTESAVNLGGACGSTLPLLSRACGAAFLCCHVPVLRRLRVALCPFLFSG